MENFANYIINETNYLKKIETIYYMQKKTDIFFDKSVIFKTEIARQFINKMKLDIDENLVITACLLYACKKVIVAKDLSQVKFYIKNGAEYLSELGFDERFCKICDGANRYSRQSPRLPESDILELVDNFGGLLLNRSDRISYGVQQALELLCNKNLRGLDNRYLEKFKEFIFLEEGVRI